MPEPIEITKQIILSPDSKLRESFPVIYQLPEAATHDKEGRVRYMDQTCCADKSIRRWLNQEYGAIELQMPDKEHTDQSEIFALVREPEQRWWSGVREWMNNLPWYAWWLDEQIMQFWPHFNRFTLNQSTSLDQAKPQHLIKCDENLAPRIANFARKMKLRQYGKLDWVKNARYANPEKKRMEDKGQQQLEAWLRKNPNYQKKLDDYLEPDYNWWNKVKYQD